MLHFVEKSSTASSSCRIQRLLTWIPNSLPSTVQTCWHHLTMDITSQDPMGHRPLVLPAVFIGLAIVGLVIMHRLFVHPLSRFPGPRLWGATRLPWLYYTFKGTLYRELESLHQKYGPAVRIAPGELSFCSPAAWPDIYTSRPVMPKEPTSQTPPLNGANSLFTAVGEEHQRLRGSLVAAFSDKALRDQAPAVESHIVAFIARLRRELARGGEPVLDLHKFFGYAALDTIVDLSYGEPMNALAEHNEHDWVDRFFLHGRFSTWRMCTCWFYPLDRVVDFLVLNLTRRQRKKNWAVFGSKIEARVDKGVQPDQRPDLMSPVLPKVSDAIAKGTRSITKKEVLSHTLASVVANSQLTTVMLTTVVYLLLRNKQALQTAVDEVRQRFPNEDDITVQSTQGLVYLEAVLNESMRLHHPTPILLPRVVPPEGRHIDGQFVPGRTIVGVNLHVVHTSPEYWVEPLAFRPERFLPRDDARYDAHFDQDVKAAFQPFSTGPRNCIGGK